MHCPPHSGRRRLLQLRPGERQPQLIVLRRHLGETLAAQGDLAAAEQTLHIAWSDAVSDGRVRASGERSDLGAWLPLASSDW